MPFACQTAAGSPRAPPERPLPPLAQGGVGKQREQSGLCAAGFVRAQAPEQSPNCTTDKRQQPEKYCTWISMQAAFLPAEVTPSLKTCECKVG